MAGSIVSNPLIPQGTSHSVYEIITSRIVAELEHGVVPWRRPWSAKLPVNLCTQKEYRGLNVLTLGSQGYASRFWLTLNQANRLGGRIRRGERSSPGHLLEHRRGKGIRDARGRHARLEARHPSILQRLQSHAGRGDSPLRVRALHETRTNDPIDERERVVAAMPNRPTVEQSDRAWYAPGRDVVGDAFSHPLPLQRGVLLHPFSRTHSLHGTRLARGPRGRRSRPAVRLGVVLPRGTRRGSRRGDALRNDGDRESHDREFRGVSSGVDCTAQG